MGNIIQWADYAKALNEITKEQQLVSGMSVEEAASALNYTKSASGMYLKTVMSTSAESIAGTTATEVAAGATEAASTTAVNLTLVEGAGGVAEVAGVGAVALPIAASMAAGTGGYLIGKELNKNKAYSTFWGNLVFSVGNFITGNNLKYDYDEENAPTVPLLYDASGKTYLPSDMTSSIKSYLDSFKPVTDYDLLPQTYNFSPSLLPDVSAYKYITVTHSINREKLNIYVRNDMPYTVIPSDGTIWGYNYKSSIYFIELSYNPIISYLYASNTFFQFMTASNHEQIVFSNYDVRYNNNPGVYDNTGSIIFHASPSTPTLPAPVTTYTPSTALENTPITDATGKKWSRAYLPSTSPKEDPDGEPVPSTEPDPSRLTPYIAPTQPQPAEVPIKVPATTPTNPIIIPNPEPDASTNPYPAPEPALDPSQLADNPTPTAPENIPDPINQGAPVLPVVPSVPAPSSAKGLLHVYNPTQAQIDSFGEWLWTTFSGDLIDTISKLFNNPMDAVIGLHELYCTPTTGSTMNIRAGFLDSGVASRLVSSRYIEIHCGALSVPEYWKNYLDYSPYTKSFCYLPFIGIVELNADDIVGSGVEITYRVDTYNGSCIAIITTAKPNSAESVTYQYEGNCSVSVPITSGMLTALQNGLMGIATTALSAGATAAVTAATGGVALPAAVLAGTVAAGGTKQGLTSKNQVQYSGSFGSSYGAMGIKKPFLIIKRPRQKVVYGYNTNYGYPAHKMVLLSTCTGYLRAIEVDVISSTATETEKKMIEESLKSGVFLN